MQYSGGKEKIAGRIAAVLQPHVDNAGLYAEPFLGGASVFSRIQANAKAGSDGNLWLMRMWRMVQIGWEPPDDLSEEEYNRLKLEKPDDPLTAFAGFGCSFGGKWFGGYARNSQGTNYAAIARRSIAKKSRGLKSAMFFQGDYRDMPIPSGSVVYCDPPYADTTDGYSTERFDSVAFWDWVRSMEGRGHPVFVSEYAAPSDFVSVAAFPKKVTMDKRNGYQDRTEHLWRLLTEAKS